ncbi:sensor histidine kinase [Pontibacter chinhatensis]|uniref:Histidine kinase-, DNA gyrase B-, and HSP90-like ATPase n=1 Tax=Pontibacter chinhatensis TaxID=1436961 RepID=A0A1I2WKI6_9BACT|nr:sensor histidine kinase [Pontibacter chinhatensis]SFH00866.1 Histidine kinase-, DNA gyrase B-, and HSP90-like ATPase [Pontibacter chinhatensis]
MKTLDPLILITPVMLMLAVGIIVFVVLYQRRMLQHQEQLRELQSVKQQQLLEATLHAQEEERRRVARDLHDEVGAMLALVRLNLHQMVSNTECKDEKMQEGARHMKQQLDEVLNSVRRISHDLMPVVLEKMGLAQALDALRRNLAASGFINLTVSYNDKTKRLKPKHELLLYRMVQELLNNTIKHAQATQISIELRFSPSETVLLYKDNGVGFDMATVQQEQVPSGGLGIMSLQSRAALMDGSIEIVSAPGTGTSASITIPQASPEHTHNVPT